MVPRCKSIIMVTMTMFLFMGWSNFVRAESEEQINDMIEAIVSTMSKDELLGQKIILGPPWIDPDGGDYKSTKAYEELSALVSKYKIGNFMLSDINYRDWFAHKNGSSDLERKHKRPDSKTIRDQTKFLRNIVHDYLASKVPPMIATDFEGGVVQHFRDLDGDGKLLETPSPMNYAATRDPKLTNEFGEKVGDLLRSLGFTTNFAPLVDVTREEQLAIIGTRAYSSDEELVGIMATSFSQGLAKAGIAPVLKHWPGLGTIQEVESTSEWNPNIDIHALNSPLTLRSSVDQFNDIYRKVLSERSISPYPAVMTAHVLATEYAKKCGRKQNVVTFCSHIIKEQLRDSGVGIKDKVIISDDFAYLRATRSWGKLSSALKSAFDADHDMVIIGALYPNEYKGYRCVEGENRIGCYGNTIEHALDKLYGANFNKNELMESVKRILKWKLAMYVALEGESAYKNWLNNEYTYDQRNIADLVLQIEKHSKKVFDESLVIVGPSDLKPRTFHEKIKVGPRTQIRCVAPTYNRNDLRIALSDHFENTKCLDLKYLDSELQKEEEFVKENVENIIKFLDEDTFEVFIFGLVNKPAHLKVWNEVYMRISKKDFKSRHPDVRYLLVAFNSPAILSSIKVGDDVSILTTFSNSREANHLLARTLQNKVSPKGAEYLPVEVKPFRERIDVNPGGIRIIEQPVEKPWWSDVILNWYALAMGVIAFVIIAFVFKRGWLLGFITATAATLALLQIGDENIPEFIENFDINVAGLHLTGEFLWGLFGPLILAFVALYLIEFFQNKILGQNRPQDTKNEDTKQSRETADSNTTEPTPTGRKETEVTSKELPGEEKDSKVIGGDDHIKYTGSPIGQS